MNAIGYLPTTKRSAQPWLNGGGSTTEVAVFPRGAGLADFAWRISIADVRTTGPFSNFDGIDRILVMLEGEIDLTFDQAGPPVHLTPNSPPHPFPGDAPVTATLPRGPALDLNVMVRRGSWHASVAVVTMSGFELVQSKADTTFVLFGAEGAVQNDGAEMKMLRHDAIRIDRETDTILARGDGPIYVVGLSEQQITAPCDEQARWA